MKSETPHNLENRSLPLKEAHGQISILEAIHSAEYAVLDSARKVFQEDGEYETNKFLFDQADSSYKDLQSLLHEILQGEEVTENDFRNIEQLSKKFSAYKNDVLDLLQKSGYEVVKKVVEEGNVIEEITESKEPIQSEPEIKSYEEDNEELDTLEFKLRKDFDKRNQRNHKRKFKEESLYKEREIKGRIEPYVGSDTDVNVSDFRTEPTLNEVETVEENTSTNATEEVPLAAENPASTQTVEENVGEPKQETDIEALTQMYRNADEKVFYVSNSEGKNIYKKLNVVIGEIREVLEREKFNPERIAIFMNEVEHLRIEIRNLGTLKSKEKNPEEKNKYKNLVSEKYQELREAVAGFIATEKIDEELGIEGGLPEEGDGSKKEGRGADESLPSVEELDKQLAEAKVDFDKLKQSFADIAFDEDTKKSIATAEHVISLVEHYNEADETRAAHDKARYLSALQKSIAHIKEATQPESGQEFVVEGVKTGEYIPREVNSLADDAEVVSLYATEREKWAEAKETFKSKEQEYKSAMKAYYDDTSWRAKLRTSVGSIKELFGISPELPPALKQMQSEYKQLRAVYAESLDKVLTERSLAVEGNKEYSLDKDKTKIAFGRKFILKPNQELLSLQENAALTVEGKKRLGSIMQTLSKHKWHTRVGSVAFAGVIGAASGGVGLMAAGAGWQAWKIAAAGVAGAGAAKLARKGMQGGVDAAAQNLASIEKSIPKNFSLENLDKDEQNLINAVSAQKVAKKRQTVATVASAVVAGGTTGWATGAYGAENILNNDANSQAALDSIATSESTSGVSDAVYSPEQAPFVESAPMIDEETLKKVTNLEEVDGAAESVESFVSKITVPHYSPDGTFMATTTLEDIHLVGLDASALTEAQQIEINQLIRLTSNDLLSAHPNMSEAVLETELLEKLQNRFGATDWWKEAGVTKVDIDSMGTKLSDEFETGPTINPETEEASAFIKNPEGGEIIQGKAVSEDDASFLQNNGEETAPVVEKVEGNTYTVEKGDTLWDIIGKQYAEELKSVSPEKHNEIIDKLVDKIQADNSLRESLGLRSGDADLIYAGEKINLTEIEQELETLISREQILEEFQKSAKLPIEADYTVTQDVPITVIENQVPAVEADYTVTQDVPPTVIEQTTPVEAPAVPPKAFSFSGNYLNQPEYKEFILEKFGSEKAFAQTIERTVDSIDETTYDFFDRSSFFGGQNFVSPYDFLKDMSLEQIEDFEQMPNNELRAVLERNDIKYDTYLAWLDQIDKMKPLIPHQSSTTLADLFGRFVAESHVQPTNILTRKI